MTRPRLACPLQHILGEEKARLGWLKLAMLTVIAGCYVGFGFSICLLVRALDDTRSSPPG
jgi:hypothetical protein